MIKTSMRVLLVEDNEADIVITRRILKKLIESPEIAVVEDLAACKLKLISFVPDVVISDYNLPTCTGLEILQLVRQKDPELPLIFLTGTVRDENFAANTVLNNAFGFILKKDMEHLEENLKPLLKNIAFKMDSRDEVRERLRQNKIAINQINDYLYNLNVENENNRKRLNDGDAKKAKGRDPDLT